jgi:hypothetical protein
VFSGAQLTMLCSLLGITKHALRPTGGGGVWRWVSRPAGAGRHGGVPWAPETGTLLAHQVAADADGGEGLLFVY